MSTDALLLVGRGRLLMAQPAGASAPGPLADWAIRIEDGRIAWVGARTEAPPSDKVLELGDALVTPGLVDSHTHPAFAGDRSDEAAARLEGASYTGGGILRTVAATRTASDNELLELIRSRLVAALRTGTTTIECKSGYGLSTSEELRALRLIGEAADRLPIRVVRTLLGAHAVPTEASSIEEYVGTVAEEMVPAAAEAGTAEFCDVFCDRGFFSPADTERILSAALRHGLGIRLHAEQLARTGAAELAVRLGAASADHLEQLDSAGVAALAASATVATLLPGPAVVVGAGLPPARALLDAGATVALASDGNAGTFDSFSMPLVIGLAATLLDMTVAEAVGAATSGGAAALGLSGRRGIVRAGADADLVAWDAEHEGAFALHLGDLRPLRSWIGGREVSL
ncbi:MAG TPA: imidazolonepropionase [Candidatus Saccharimonadales bacterium]|nr:imidazolonepropionase [Candidatus Saccharimonadales bacterium]